jgi:predicted house-cleaning noncanonical NTP pyrophosphatase (MazG superfamily)
LEQIYNKAIRDKIPEIILNAGKKPQIRQLSNDKFLIEMEKKLLEEVTEYQESKSIEELADILEVVYRIAELKGSSSSDLEAIRNKKLVDRGGFKNNLFLVKTH